MRIQLELTRAQLKALSAVSSNLVVFWLAALFATRDSAVLIFDFIFAMIFWYLTVKAEEALND